MASTIGRSWFPVGFPLNQSVDRGSSMDHPWCPEEIRCADRFKPSLGAIRQQLLQQLGLTKAAQIKVPTAGAKSLTWSFPPWWNDQPMVE